MARPQVADPREVHSIRLTHAEKTEMEIVAERKGFKSISDYLRSLHKLEIDEERKTRSLAYKPYPEKISIYHTTKLGKMLNGDCRDWLFDSNNSKSVDLIMTSPPFGLVRKKTYGNEDAHEYCNWFRPFAEGFKRVLKDRGSLVIDIGGAWKAGMPTRSLYHFELLIMLCNEFGFHLCQEHYWWNPAKLPTPAEWVNVRRVRVKDAVNCIWWLSLTPYPRANNKRVLAPYSDSMKDLLRNGYTAKLRPSGHDISTKFQKDNGGSVPPNLMAIANTESNGVYQDYCRQNGFDIHPARFPYLVPAYFIRFLTNPGDLVLDPFAGSCVTGLASESLRRKWLCIETNTSYLQGALARFGKDAIENSGQKSKSYSITTPCAMPIDEAQVPLVENGGASR
jgi:DNA modification methylase